MHRFNRSLLAACVVSGLCGGVGIAAAALSSNNRVAQPLKHERHIHMHHAMANLKDARAELENADRAFGRHREKAMEEVDLAMKDVEAGLREQHDEAFLPGDLPRANPLARHKHMHHAMEILKSARSELDSAENIFGGHREEAIKHVDLAIKHGENGIHEVEK